MTPLWTPATAPVGTIVVVYQGDRWQGGESIHVVAGYRGPHVLTVAGERVPETTAGTSPWEWSRNAGRARGGTSSRLSRVATIEDIADQRLRNATKWAIARLAAARQSNDAAGVLEQADRYHWLTGGES